ncbi:metallophosphoesterase [Corallococcus sp. CA053C]|uniref:metallophosphoesterase family protein n=1 Tax=Corallococcus sp. CA053C TaxID=2316732 RepID=UPI0018F3D35B|nr:metallophosphoesterase [Corallococcus sp. CA053C]
MCALAGAVAVGVGAGCSGPEGTHPPAGTVGDPVLLAAGDIGNCGTTQDTDTGNLLDALPGTIALLGDLAYTSGTPTEFNTCFDPAWGRHKARMKPTPGNHEYLTSGAAGYYGYFGALAGDPSKGYYSYNLGDWHLVALNSNCAAVGGCGAGSAQETWLRQDLAANPRTCTLAYWHHPRFSSGSHGDDTTVQPLWKALDDAGADLILTGHDHDYERWKPQTAAGTATANGIVQFVVGTGGTSLRAFTSAQPANSALRDASTWGVLKLTLHSTSYDWEFVPIAGQTFTDKGTGACH